MFTSRFASVAPFCPRVTVTRLAVMVCAAKLRLEACGRPVPVGYTVSRLAVVLLNAVTLTTTAVALAGIGSAPPGSPVTPVICNVRVSPAANAPVPHWMHGGERVSRIRNGATGTYPARLV